MNSREALVILLDFVAENKNHSPEVEEAYRVWSQILEHGVMPDEEKNER